MARTFLALPLSDHFLKPIEDQEKLLDRAFDGVKWIAPVNVHITLHFFGPTTEDELQSIESIVTPIARRCKRMSLRLNGIGFFPNANKARIVWLGVGGDVEVLEHLQKAMAQALHENGFPSEERVFKPHATIGRVRRDGRLQFRNGHAKTPQRCFETERRLFREIVLYESHLNVRGSRYEIIRRFPLA